MPSLAEDVNFDELRRRARRRLVGAIVLALAAAVIVPMLLESEPKPLGEDVAVKIPPVDDGKFVNRLNDSAAKADKAPARAPDAKEPRPTPEPARDGKDARAAEPAKAADAARPKYDTRLTDKDAVPTEAVNSPAGAGAAPTAAGAATTAPAPSAGTATAAPTPPAPPPTAAAASAPPAVATAKPAPAASAPPRQGAAPAAPAAPSPAAAPAATNGGGFAVQLAAFSDDKGANALAGRLKRAGYTAYTEPYKTSKGTLWRVRVGPYPSRETANAARDKLKAEGQSGIVAPAH